MSDSFQPIPTPDSQRYWDAAAEGRLEIQRCLECDRPYFYPRDACPNCGSERVEWFVTAGTATLESYTISHLPAPDHKPPFVIAIVRLTEGPTMLTNVVEIEPDPDALMLDMPLVVRFKRRGDVTLPVFAPEASA